MRLFGALLLFALACVAAGCESPRYRYKVHSREKMQKAQPPIIKQLLSALAKADPAVCAC